MTFEFRTQTWMLCLLLWLWPQHDVKCPVFLMYSNWIPKRSQHREQSRRRADTKKNWIPTVVAFLESLRQLSLFLLCVFMVFLTDDHLTSPPKVTWYISFIIQIPTISLLHTYFIIFIFQYIKRAQAQNQQLSMPASPRMVTPPWPDASQSLCASPAAHSPS